MKKFLVFCLIGSSLLAADSFQQTYPFTPGQTLAIDLPGGNITIVGEARQDVFVQYEYNNTNRDFELKMSKSSQGISLVGDRGSQRNLRLHLEIKVPNQTDLDLKTKGGNLDLSNLLGKFVARTMGGNIRLT
ncbi:MAG: hypothetical protein H6510_13450, partial [Acidobacteria bacterium]|nr:hypothetical protein [Acidobacteriota bacterium]